MSLQLGTLVREGHLFEMSTLIKITQIVLGESMPIKSSSHLKSQLCFVSVHIFLALQATQTEIRPWQPSQHAPHG